MAITRKIMSITPVHRSFSLKDTCLSGVLTSGNIFISGLKALRKSPGIFHFTSLQSFCGSRVSCLLDLECLFDFIFFG